MTCSTPHLFRSAPQRLVAFALAAAGTLPFIGGVFDFMVLDGAWLDLKAGLAATGNWSASSRIEEVCLAALDLAGRIRTEFL